MAPKKTKPEASKAATADRYVLYQRSVQAPECESSFFVRAFRKVYGRAPLILREDFCGTAAVCGEWVSGHPERRAYGVDIDPEPLAWGAEHNLSKLSAKARARVELIEGDVRSAKTPKADVLAAQNFSFFCFKTRDELRRYFKAARANLAAQGVMVLDVMGGPETLEEDREEITDQGGFKYVWELKRFDPITHHCRYYIHFRFRDGSCCERAFTYDWRMWSIPEIRELLEEAGFSDSQVYWEGTDRKTGEGNGVYRLRKHAESDPAWVAYIVGVK